jgi:hypothetical protein
MSKVPKQPEYTPPPRPNPVMGAQMEADYIAAKLRFRALVGAMHVGPSHATDVTDEIARRYDNGGGKK